MKKLLCFLVILFLVPAACAQSAAPYVPGAVTEAIFAEAFDRGDMILADMNWSVDFNQDAAVLLNEDAALLDALSEALRSTTLTLGAGKTENGLRLLIASKYAADQQQAALDLTLDLTADGFSVMSSAIPGERLSGNWDTLLLLAGVSQEEITQLHALGETDMEALLAEMSAELVFMLDLAAQIAAPYGETILAHMAALPMEVLENVPADGEFPAAATEITLSITAKALGDLVIALCDQLEADTTLCAMMDAVLAESGESMTTAQLCQAIRSAAAESLTDESMPLYICIGLSDTQSLLYFNAFIQNNTGESIVFNMISSPDAGIPARMQTSVDLLTTDAAGELMDGFSLYISRGEPTAALPSDLTGEMAIFSSGAAIFVGSFSSAETATDAAPRSRTHLLSLLLNLADDDDVISIELTSDLAFSETAYGGEKMLFCGDVNIAAGEKQLPMSFTADALTEKTQNGPAATVTSLSKMQPLGIDEYQESYKVYAVPQTLDLSRVTTIALETASPEEMTALAQRAMVSLESTFSTLSALLPDALINAVSEAAAVQP